MPDNLAINTTTDSAKPPVRPLRKPFRDWVLADVRAAIAWAIETRVSKEGFAANQKYAQDHEHFQDGAGFLGPIGGDDMAARTRNTTNVKRQFTAVDTTAEILDNLANALRTTVTVVPRKPASGDLESNEAKAQAARGAAYVEVLNRFAEARELRAKTRHVIKRSRWATWGCLRLWTPGLDLTDPQGPREPEAPTEATGETPPEAKGTDEQPTNLEPEAAFARLALNAPLPDQAFVFTDPDTQQRVGLYLFRDGEHECAELCWVTPDGSTIRKRLEATGPSRTAPVDEAGDDNQVGGLLPLVQLDGELLLTEPARMQQAAVNFYNSVMVRVIETAGFAERYVINAMPEGRWQSTAPQAGETPAIRTQEVGGVTWYLIPSEGRTLGSSITTELKGDIDKDPESAKERTLVPTVIFKEPTDPAFVIAGVEHARGMLLHQCKQGHLANTSTADASGQAYIQARAVHISDLSNMVDPTARLEGEILECAAGYASLLSPVVKAWLDEFRIVVTVMVVIGPLLPEERTTVLTQYEKGALSLHTTLTMLQVADVAGEIERIRSEPAAMRKTLSDQATVGGIFIGSWHLPAALVAEMVGLPPDMVAKIKAVATDVTEPDPSADPASQGQNGGPPPAGARERVPAGR